MDAIVLCGGYGTRLAQVVADVPKPLAPVLGRPFLDYIITHLARSGIVDSVTLAVHYRAEKIIEHYRASPPPLPVRFVREATPLGTGGAVLNALASVAGDTVLCLNGDTLALGDLPGLVAAHRAWGAGVTLGLVEVDDSARYGRVDVDDAGRVRSFREKSASSGGGLVNAGLFVVDRAALGEWDGAPVSMETVLLPRLAEHGRLFGFPLSGPFIDIGVPETYAAAAEFVSRFVPAARHANA